MNHKVLFSKILVIPMCLLLALTSVSKPLTASANDSLELSTPTVTPTATGTATAIPALPCDPLLGFTGATPVPPLSPLPAIVPIGVIYPITGRLAKDNPWGPEGVPFWEQAEKDINNLCDALEQGIQFKLVVETSDSTQAGALDAAKVLVNKYGVEAIVGLPVSYEVQAAAQFLTQHNIATISSNSTGIETELMQPDTIYRLMLGEAHLARKLADLLLELNYTNAAIIYRDDSWGPAYADEFARQFTAKGKSVVSVAIEPTHPYVTDYTKEVQELSAKVAKLGTGPDTAVVMVVWEGEDLNILQHAAADKTLSSVRWFSAAAGPAMLKSEFNGVMVPGASDFAFDRELWTQENYPPESKLATSLLQQAKKELGKQPRYEHVYMYDAVQLMARAILLAGTYDGASIANRIPEATRGYEAATGPIAFDINGDRVSGDLAYLCMLPDGSLYEYYYCAYFYDNASGGYFDILSTPEVRDTKWCPEC